ncbi:unnamed protein product [Arctia plantaginis]|uniref:Uncharacterized protein n=1 Tax=Arctia plantaginis TaxID=874455 RepID=A0A8S1AQX0_ARCPL|nr:unnamed protein product [Arctia plantaginis]
MRSVRCVPTYILHGMAKPRRFSAREHLIVGKQRSVFVVAAELRGRVLSVATAADRYRSRSVSLRARLAGHLPTSTPQARVYITRHPPPPIHPRRLPPTKQTSLGRPCNMRKELVELHLDRPPGRIALISNSSSYIGHRISNSR